MAGFLNEAKNNLQGNANNVASNITNGLQGNATEGLTSLTNGLQGNATEGLTNLTNSLQTQMPNIPDLGKAFSALNTANAISAALTPVTTKEDIIKGVALILEDKITNILEEKITKSLEEKITEKIEVKVIQKLEEIEKKVDDAIKNGAKVGGRKQKKNRITRKRRTNQKSFSRAFRRTRDRKQNSQ